MGTGNLIKLFQDINSNLKTVDPSIGTGIRCPLCRNLFEMDSLSTDLSLEHVPPKKTSTLLKEVGLKTLTCKQCNNTYGTKYQADMKKFVIHQLHWAGKYSGSIRGTISVPDENMKPLKSNIVWTKDKVMITGIPKANASFTTQAHVDTWKKVAGSGTSGWEFNLTWNYDYKINIAWAGFLHSAYLAAYVMTGGYYGYTKAGTELLKLIVNGDTNQLGPCVILPQEVGVGGSTWMGRIDQPVELRSLWVKIAGNIVIIPSPDDGTLSCYHAWQRVSENDVLGLKPNTRFKVTFWSKKDAVEAQKCLPKALGGILL